MKWGLWSVTAGSNSATPPDGWPEGQAPSTVNDCAREMMAQIRTGLNNLQFVDLGVTPTETGNTTFTLAGNQMQWYPYGNRVQANVGGNLLYGTVISSSYTSNTGVTLRFDTGQAVSGQQLTNSLSAVSTGYPSAANGALPEIVYRNDNFIDNGQFDIWQRGPGPFSLSSGASLMGPDRFRVSNSITSAGPTLAMSMLQRSAGASNVPTLAQCGVLLDVALCISCNVAVAGLGSADFVTLEHVVEGYDFRQLAGKPLTLSFWVNSDVTGTYCASFRNSTPDQSFIMQYSVSSVATWEKKTINMVKSPIGTGTWDYSVGAGLRIYFALATGGNFTGGAGNWTAGNLLATTAQTNFMQTGSKAIRFAGIKLEEGNQATPLKQEKYAQTLAKCQRYLHVFQPGERYIGYANAVGSSLIGIPLSPPVRNAASMSFSAGTLTSVFLTQGNGNAVSISAISLFGSNAQLLQLLVEPVGNVLTVGQAATFGASAGHLMVVKSEF